jgi:hypothetical protein
LLHYLFNFLRHSSRIGASVRVGRPTALWPPHMRLAMSSYVGIDRIRVELVGDEIVVWMPGTVFLVAFRKSSHQPQLSVTRSWLSGLSSKPLAEFRALAAQLAVAKAQSLGWTIEANDRKKSRPRDARLTLVHTDRRGTALR